MSNGVFATFQYGHSYAGLNMGASMPELIIEAEHPGFCQSLLFYALDRVCGLGAMIDDNASHERKLAEMIVTGNLSFQTLIPYESMYQIGKIKLDCPETCFYYTDGYLKYVKVIIDNELCCMDMAREISARYGCITFAVTRASVVYCYGFLGNPGPMTNVPAPKVAQVLGGIRRKEDGYQTIIYGVV